MNRFLHRQTRLVMQFAAQFGAVAEEEPPAAIDDLAAEAVSFDQVDLTWTLPEGATGVRVERSETSGSGFSELATIGEVETYSDETAVAETEYFYIAIAFNDAGDADDSNEASDTTPAEGSPPATPTLSLTNVSDTGFDVALACDSTETSVNVEYSVGSASWPGSAISMSGSPGNWTGSLGTQTPLSTIYVRGAAINDDGTSAYDEDSATLYGPPAAPSGVTQGGTTSSAITISWTDNSDNEDNFEVQYSGAGMGSWSAVSSSPIAANATSAEHTGLNPETGYDFRVCATNAYGSSAWAEGLNFMTTA